jgi:type IV pilus assembly protein PilW
MNANRPTPTRLCSPGFSIVELMVAMTIGLIILLATTTIFVQSKQSHTTQDSLARLQENSRFAMQFLMRDLRMAGYYGCADDVTSVVNTLDLTTSGGEFDASNPVQGSENKSNWYPLVPAGTGTAPPTKMHPGTDAITIRYADTDNAIDIVPPFMPNTSAALKLGASNGLSTGEIIMVTDCSSTSVFQITGPDEPNCTTPPCTINHNTGASVPGNVTKNLGKIYEGDAQIVKFYYAGYYIAPGASNQPALFRDTLVVDPATNTSKIQAQELVEGIENMQIVYGEDMSGDRIPDRYVKADTVANWRNVMAVRIGILARSLAQTESGGKEYGPDVDTGSYDVDGDGTNDFTVPAPGDRYQRRVFRTTVLMRNLQ